ncbi:uncharacterized protein LOC105255216 [Camponotus floridanus]|uniref:uncharacterized protein LOC105255216 n=1 Tax=Camponotus floridanus TaxID=104421 RepID=UPI000DC6B058|nr:uncharacterized protein LOC105255216 [Camponotus floridanus]
MYEQTINKYYTNLEYHFVTKEEALIVIHNLSKQIKEKDVNLSHRFFDTALIIGTHLLYFVPICKHIDVVVAIIEYLQYYGGQFVFNQEYDKAEYAYKEHYIPISLMLTVFNMCREEAIILFLQRAIIDDSALFMSEIFLSEK